MQAKKNEKKSKLKVGFIARGALAGIIISAALLMLAAILLEKGTLNEKAIPIAALVINVTAGLACGVAGGGGGLGGLLSGAIYAAVCILPAYFIDGAQPEPLIQLRILLISAVGGLLGSKINLFKSNKRLHRGFKNK